MGILDSNWKDSQQSPVFIQFLDCVRQILLQFPQLFEFKGSMLLYIAKEIQNCKYGTFLGNCAKDREELEVRTRTASMWSYILSEHQKFRNALFNPDLVSSKGYSVIESVSMTSHFCLQEWRELFYRWSEWGHDSRTFSDFAKRSTVLSEVIQDDYIKPKEKDPREQWTVISKKPLEPFRIGVLAKKRSEIFELVNQQE